MFVQVGIVREILTYQGSNFISQMLHVKAVQTSPHQPQTNGLVEHFNQP